MATVAQRPTGDIQISAAQLPVRVTGMQSMASKMWIPFIGMGFMIVVAALVIGIIVSTTAGDYFGFWIAISGDKVLIGAHSDDAKAKDSAAAYLFLPVPTNPR